MREGEPGAIIANVHTEPPMLSRVLLTIDGRPCPFGCRYCFTRFSQYEAPLTLAAVEADPSLLGDAAVLYPACDVDLFARRDALEVVERTARLGRSISISTKARIRPSVVEALGAVSARLAGEGRVLKVAVSISAKARAAEIEPHTPAYRFRLATLAALASAGVPTALVLRPLLPDVPIGEYEEILEDARGLATAVLVGDEYVDRDPERRRPIAGDDPLATRAVNWAAGRPTWPVRDQAARAEHLTQAARTLGLRVYASDLELMGALLGHVAASAPARAV